MLVQVKQMTNEEQCYKNIAVTGIVGQACRDYLEAKKIICLEERLRSPNEKNIREAKRMVSECKRFFNSEWYTHLCTISGEVMLRKLDEEFEERKANNFEKKKKT